MIIYPLHSVYIRNESLQHQKIMIILKQNIPPIMILNHKIFAVMMLLLLTGVIPLKAQFTPGNIVVERLGDATYSGGTSSATPIYLDEYTTDGTYIQTVALPTATANGNYEITENGVAGKAGVMTLSANGKYLCVTGFVASPGLPNVSNTTSSANPRIIARIDYNGTVNSTTRTSVAFNTGKIRSAATIDGSEFWACGNQGGVQYWSSLGATSIARAL